MKKILSILVSVSTILACADSNWKNSLAPKEESIVLKPIQYYKINISKNARKQELFAAKLLQEKLFKITRHKLPVVDSCSEKKFNYISIAGCDKKLGADGYRIEHKDGNLFFLGGSRRGPVNAVLAFLEEDLGWRDYSIFTDEIYPDYSDKLLHVAPREYIPRLNGREVHIVEGIDKNSQWALYNRATPMFFPAGNRMSKDKQISQAGGAPHYPKGWFVHTFGRLVDKKLFEINPELFAESNGKRQAGNICLSNPETVKLAAARVIDTIAKDPFCKYISVSQNDGEYVICVCKKCRAMSEREESQAGPVINFVNQVAEIVYQSYPKVKISTLAYMSTYKTPKNIKPSDKIVIFLATDKHTWKAPFHFVDETPQFKNALAEWNKICTHISIWDYSFGDNFNWMNPSPNFDVMAYNLRYITKFKNVKDYVFQDNWCSYGSSRAAMKNWIFTKLMWNPSLEVKELEKDFTLGYYGPAGKNMQKYNELLREEWQNYHQSNRSGIIAKPFKVSAGFIPKSKTILNQALEAAKENTLLTAEIEREYICLIYQQLEKGYEHYESMANYCQDIERMRFLCKKLKINSFAENANYENKFTSWKLSLKRAMLAKLTPNAVEYWLDTAYLPQVGAGTAKLIDDEDAEGKKTIIQPQSTKEWSVQWRIKPDHFIKRAERHKLQVRVKCSKKRKDNGEALEYGIYTLFSGKIDVKHFSEDKYTWINVGPAFKVPDKQKIFYISGLMKGIFDYIYIDKIALIPESEWHLLRK